ncbi:SusC/RagA family TonB-linked outer membrane protein [Maribacter sp. 2307ULW6-5]|uniref:SusC/RagA family TonB-linked outer membrane protein n=1 Tax=Maribacter sp. 2307ULW6-5 TaxID=3386275 RepID=UPI0039BCBD4F
MENIPKYVLFCLFAIPLGVFGQMTVSGTVTEADTGMPLPGVNIVIKGTTTGTATDFDGNYILEANEGDVLSFSYISYKTQEVTVTGPTLNVVMEEDAAMLDEVVVIGYGTTTVDDATGSVDLITTEDFNQGAIVSTDQLLNGKAAGVRITTAGGSPDAAPNIRIRGGASLNAQNNPLIVIDGVPIGQDNPAGVANPLNLINPNDIESFSILKDASATAIYGSRASNGVLIITTKKGTSGDLKFNVSSDVSVSSAGEGLDMMNSAEYLRFMNEFNPGFVDLLGVPAGTVQNDEPSRVVNGREIYDTDWRDAVLRTAFTSNTNFSLRGSIADRMPIRASLGYTNAEGIVRTDDYERITGSVKLTPYLFDDKLKIDFNAKAIYAKKNAIDGDGALGGSLVFDPTKPILNNAADNPFGGFYTNTTADGNLDGGQNPLALLLQRERPEDVFRFLGNVEFDYELPFVKGLNAVLNLGLDKSQANIEEVFAPNAIATFRNDFQVFNPGVNFREDQDITNTTLDFYLKYAKRFDVGFLTNFDAQAGYAYQNFENDGVRDEFIYSPDTGLREELFDANNPENRYYNVLNLQSFFGRTNFSFLGRYLLTLSVRADGSSLFQEGNRWGYFPSAALAWQINEEAFLENSRLINQLKLRLGWGQTGQQDITGAVGFYPSRALFIPGSPTSQYLPGLTLYSANPFNPDLTWEKTTTYNAGLDFDLFSKGVINGSFDAYWRETTDLLARVPLPPGQALTNSFIKNAGATESYGFETALNITPIQTDDLTFRINSNFAYNYVEITNLEGADLIPADGTLRGTGATLRYHGIGSQPFSALVFKQVYDKDGAPIPNAFVDRNGDNQITFEDRYLKPTVPNWTYGFGVNLNYKKWDLSAAMRGQIGGLVYDFNLLNFGFTESAIPVNNNVTTNVLNFYDGAADPVFRNVLGNVQFSDYYLRDASFLRFDNIALGRTFDHMIKNGTVRMYAAVTNPFLFTNYEGQDPENFGAIDRNFYPRPTVYTFGLNIGF